MSSATTTQPPPPPPPPTPSRHHHHPPHLYVNKYTFAICARLMEKWGDAEFDSTLVSPRSFSMRKNKMQRKPRRQKQQQQQQKK